MPRSVPEWIGKTDDSQPPPRVRLRVFERWDGKCHITGIKIRAGDLWECDHIKRLKDGGENRESNLAPALKWAHSQKTAAENAAQAKADRLRKKHLGIYKKGPKIPSRPWPKKAR